MKCIASSIFTLLALVSAAAASAAVKWHPGHYLMLDAYSSQATHFSQINEIANVSSIKGVELRVWWYQLETSKGKYNFSKVDTYLKKVKSLPAPKRLVVRIMDRKFGVNSRSGIVPTYLMSERIYRGGVTASKNGYVARLWEAPVMDRLIAVYQAMGRRYDNEPYFEGIRTGETTLGFGKSAPAGYSHAALENQYERLARSARAAMPRTSLFFSTNYLGNNAVMGELIQSFVGPGVAVGGPNVMPYNMTQGQRVWTGQFGADFRGLLPIVNSVEPGELGGNLGNYTPKQISNFAYGTLHVSHLFWSRNTWSGNSGQRWSTGILPFLRTNPPTRTNCPTVYGLCSK
jgi:hypothetical protein